VERLKPGAGRAPHRPGRAPHRPGSGHDRPSEEPVARPAPRQRRAFSTLGGPVELGGDREAARALGKIYDVESSLERALTHGFHSYAGRLHPSIARGGIAAFSAPGDTVVDPFCGSGTVLVEAMGLGRRAMGVDASPLGVAIARARTTLLGDEGRERLVSEAARIAEESGARARKRKRPEVPRWARREITRFHAHVLFELLGLRELVMATPDDPVGHALRLCLSSLLVKFMKAGPTAPRDGADKRIGRGVPSRMLADRAAELAQGLAALERRTPPGTPSPEVTEGDARSLSIKPGSVALVLSSPPYAGTYDYAAIHDARFLWLGLEDKKFQRVQLGARAERVGDVAGGSWRDQQAQFILQIARILRPGGRALLVVGDGVVDGRAENAPDSIAAAGAAVGLEAVARASQARPLHDRRLAEIFGGQPRREHLLLLEKRATSPTSR
jgi:SAM-dependent methyltransferase